MKKEVDEVKPEKNIRNKKRKKKESVDENEIRRKELKELHKLIDEQIEKRQHRIALAQAQKDTTRQWDLVAAAVEQANIEYHKLQGTEAKTFKGIS